MSLAQRKRIIMAKQLFGVISTAKASSGLAAATAKNALALINQIRSIEATFLKLASEAENLGLARRSETEGDLEYLARVAKESNVKAHELACAEDAAKVDAMLTSTTQPRRTGFAGLLDRAADRVASL
jgi:hypothetical protein